MHARESRHIQVAALPVIDRLQQHQLDEVCALIYAIDCYHDTDEDTETNDASVLTQKERGAAEKTGAVGTRTCAGH
jgi:hypothetical protein